MNFLEDIQAELAIMRKYSAFNSAWLHYVNDDIYLRLYGIRKQIDEHTVDYLKAEQKAHGIAEFPGYENNKNFQKCLSIVRDGYGTVEEDGVYTRFRFDSVVFGFNQDSCIFRNAKGLVYNGKEVSVPYEIAMIEDIHGMNKLEHPRINLVSLSQNYICCVKKYLPLFLPYHKSADQHFIFEDELTKLSTDINTFIGNKKCTEKQFNEELKIATKRVFSLHGFKFNDWDDIEVKNKLVSELATNGYTSPQIKDNHLHYGNIVASEANLERDASLNGASDLFLTLPKTSHIVNDFFL